MAKKFYTTILNAQIHDNMMPLLEAMYLEFKELSKKKPDAAVSKSKILITNRLLDKIREVLANETSIDFLDLLDVDDVPQVSDVTLMLSQYVAAMNGFKETHHGFDGKGHNWFIK